MTATQFSTLDGPFTFNTIYEVQTQNVWKCLEINTKTGKTRNTNYITYTVVITQTYRIKHT